MISIDDYWMGRDKTHAAELTAETQANATALLVKVNQLLDLLEIGAVKVSSGWRPVEINKSVGGAAHSNHITGHAVDIADQYRWLAKAILRNTELLVRCGLYLEDPTVTKSWVHLQDVAPKSGKRIFIP